MYNFDRDFDFKRVAPSHYPRPSGLLLKRIFDAATSAFVLMLLAPLFLLVALLVKFDTSGPIFFSQRRGGRDGETFRIWKFRTMTTLDDGDQIEQAKKGDARITRVGAVLRKYNIDELPQLYNVLIGDMSLVGPRPHAIAHDKYYKEAIPQYFLRHDVAPGITGWAQVNGLRGPTEDLNAMRTRVEYDIEYIQTWSLTLDLYILLLTVISPAAYRNAY
jgi:exopolysaccharide biosynthesis polyprenyl glycosylphosphotransferase